MAARGATGGAVVLALLLGGCGLFEQDDPRDDAEAFAAAVTSGELSSVPLTGPAAEGAQEWWTATREDMGESRHEVTVGSVGEPSDDRVTATLRHRWTLEGEERPGWTYDTEVDLVRREETWAVDLDPSALVPGLEEGERLRLSSTAPERGDIVGAGDEPLVTERPVVRFGIDKTRVPAGRAAASARRLAALLDVDAGSFAERVDAAGDRAFVEAVVLRKEDVTAQVGGGYDAILGAAGIADEMPLAPTRDFARPILGIVGPVTAEMVEESDGEYSAGDVAGLSGLQQRYDDRLRGRPGTVVTAAGEDDDERVLHEAGPEDGEALRLTLDVDLQMAAEAALAQVGPASALVAVRPSTGELLAAASGPGSDGYSTATVGQYAPGSTFKVVSSLALLRAGMSPGDTVSCPRSVVVDGKRFENYSDYPQSSLGRISLTEAVAQSCNTAFVSQAERVSADDLAQAAEALGVGTDHDVGFPSFFGEVPTDTSETEHAAALIGQGRVLASPMAMAAVAGSVTAGRTVVPHLVVGEEAEPDPAASLTGQEARRLRALMGAVVERGSGAGLADVPGPDVIAKTGTAEFGDEVPPRTHAWMIASRGDLAIAAFVEVGESGSRTAGPLLEELLRRAG